MYFPLSIQPQVIFLHYYFEHFHNLHGASTLSNGDRNHSQVMQDWQSVAQQWNKLQQSGQSIEIDRERMENEAKKILNDIVISGKKLTLDQQQQLLDVVLGLGGLATRMASAKGGK